jgi:pimeloyl-ACP methyl ester carboxylesterase
MYASGDRTAALRRLDVPTLVIHGRDDTLITPSAAAATADAIPGANLLMVGDMGHDLPPPLWPLIVGSILGISAGS